MKKLSALKKNTKLLITTDRNDLIVMDKEDFLHSPYFLDYPVAPYPPVCLGVPEVASFDLQDVIERLGEDDMYEGWCEDVLYTINSKPETKAFMDMLKSVFASHPTYYEGEAVEIDMTPEKAGVTQ